MRYDVKYAEYNEERIIQLIEENRALLESVGDE